MRGWLKGINDTGALAKPGDPADLFAFSISYENPQATQPQFNGNISETYWRTANDNMLRKYAYQFDSMGRLASASYQKPETVSATDSYRESQQYDKNGNIRKLQRYGEFDDAVVAMMVDDLDYAYLPNSNRVAKVTDHTNNPAGFRDDSDGTNDSEDDYAYDSSGNMVSDQNKNIDHITYNHLNLPISISFGEGAATIEYLYNAVGKKLRKTVTESPKPVKIQEYLDGFDYANGILEAIHTAEGYVKSGREGGRSVYNYIYNYKDHLGNIRLSYTKDPVSGQVVILEENNYYPLGLTHKNYNTTKRMYDRMGGGVIEFCPDCPFPYSYNYKFNGKEFQEELGLNMTAMDFRQYDNALGRFNSLDALSELAPGISPYRFAYNNPVFWADPTGLFETKQAAMDHIQTYGLTGATVSYNNSRGYWEIDNNGYTFGYENGNFKIAYDTEDGATVFYTIKGTSFTSFFSDRSGYATPIDLNNIGLALDITGGTFGALETTVAPKNQWLGKNGKYYKSSWGGNQYTGSRSGALKAANNYKWAGRGALLGSLVVGGINIHNGYQQDGGRFGYNSQVATGNTAGSLAGGWAGAEIGASIGAALGASFFGVGAVPGAIVGAFIGGLIGSSSGGYIGEQAVKSYY
ncbi:RHS repeat-associated core domain-containing protein [Flavobacterium sp. 28YEA47A]|uniref:RHS repeat-associated core domain-containing protein n=1 Tax=Flavobacterium sp. 28YEA47A TaxID=3156276 RepID=UPI0035142FCF